MKTGYYYLSPLALVLLASGIAAQSLSDLPGCGVSSTLSLFHIPYLLLVAIYIYIYTNTHTSTLFALSLLHETPPGGGPPQRRAKSRN